MPTLYGMLKRTGLNRVIMPLVAFANRCIPKNDVHMDTEKANRLLNQYYKDSHDSCIRPNPNTMEAPEYDIAVIIPCYRCVNTIQRCLDSCVKQDTSAKYRIIAVDDGSPDDTGNVLDEYAKRCDALSVIHQSNMGAGGARNSALNVSKGKYVLFVDADDYLPDGAIDGLFSAAERENAYIVQGSFSSINSDGNIYKVDKTAGGGTRPFKVSEGVSVGKIISKRMLCLGTIPR